jgi:hypothetical protein
MKVYEVNGTEHWFVAVSPNIEAAMEIATDILAEMDQVVTITPAWMEKADFEALEDFEIDG